MSAKNNQIGGDHYSKLAIQPMEYALKNNLNYAQSNAIKYITRYKDKGGIHDLHKAIHCIELLIQHESEAQSIAAGWTPEEIEAAAFKDAYKEYTLQEVLGDAVLSDWARWVSVDADGEVWEYSHDVESAFNEWRNHEGWCKNIKKVVPPLNFRNCIWEVNVKPDCEYTLEQVIGDAELSDWARWVAVGPNGHVCVFQDYPDRDPEGWILSDGAWNYIRQITPPSDFTKCIWEVNK